MSAGHPGPAPGRRVEIARTFEELEALRPLLEQLPWGREEAVYEFFLTRLRTRPDVVAPWVAVVTDDGAPVAGLVGRVEARRLQTALGYRVVYAPRVRLLQIVDGGIAVPASTALGELARIVEQVPGAATSMSSPFRRSGSARSSRRHSGRSAASSGASR